MTSFDLEMKLVLGIKTRLQDGGFHSVAKASLIFSFWAKGFSIKHIKQWGSIKDEKKLNLVSSVNGSGLLAYCKVRPESS